MRYGTRTHCKRRWGRQGKKPLCQVKLGYAWGYLYVAICPYTGDMFSMFFTHLDKDCFAYFLTEFNLYLQHKQLHKVLLIGDGASAHTAQQWQEQNICWQKLPTACPELNPVERFFEELRRYTANRVFDNKEQVEELMGNLMQQYLRQPEKIKSITLFPYINQCA